MYGHALLAAIEVANVDRSTPAFLNAMRQCEQVPSFERPRITFVYSNASTTSFDGDPPTLASRDVSCLTTRPTMTPKV